MHALDRERKIVNRFSPLAGRILDRSADRACLCGKPDGFGGGLWFIGAAVFEVGIDGQIGGLGDGAAIRENGIPAYSRAAERIRKAKAGGCQRFEPDGCQQLGGSGVPGVRDDESAGPLMQRAKQFGFFWVRIFSSCLDFDGGVLFRTDT
jgi:hypothetical protein